MAHGDNWKFVMALHINDLVSVNAEGGIRKCYRVQKIGAQKNNFVLRYNRASTIQEKQQELNVSITPDNFGKREVKLHKVNAIGIISND